MAQDPWAVVSVTPVEKKQDAKPAKADPWSVVSTEPTSTDFAAKPGNIEGRYTMAGPGGKTVPVPYSMVPDAAKAGWKIDKDHIDKYVADAAADPNNKSIPLVVGSHEKYPTPTNSGVKVAGRNSAGQPIFDSEAAPTGIWGLLKNEYDALTTRLKPGTFAAPSPDDTSWKATGQQFIDENLTRAHNIGARAVEGTAAMIKDPVGAVKGIGQLAKDVLWDEPTQAFGGDKANGPIEQRVQEFKDTYATDPEKAIDDAAGDVLGLYLQGKVIEGVKAVGGEALDATPVGAKIDELKAKAKESARQATQTLLGAGRRKIATMVAGEADKGAKEQEAVEAARQKAEEATNKDKGIVDEKNKKLEAEHLEELRKAQTRREDIAREHALKVKKQADEYAKDLEKHQQEVEAVRQKNAEELAKHLAERERISEMNQAAKSAPDAIAGIEEQIRNDSAELVKRGDELEKETKKEADRRYAKQREWFNDETIPPVLPSPPGEIPRLTDANVKGRIVDAYRDSITGTTGDLPKIIKSIEDRMNVNDPLTWRDLQGYRTEIGKMLSSGNLPGDEYWGYKNALETIDEALQMIADDQGRGDQVRADRKFYSDYMKAFADPAAEKVTNLVRQRLETTPEYIRDQAAQARTAMYAADPQYKVLTDAIRSARTRLKALQDEGPSRGLIKEYPPAPTPVPLPPAPPEPAPPMGPLMSHVKPLPDRPAPIEYPEPHPRPDFTPKTVDTREMRDKLIETWAHGEEKLNSWQVRSLIRSTIGPVLGAIAGEATGRGYGGVATGAMIGATFGPALIARLVDYAPVREWLTRPPADELAGLQKIPHADRVKIVDGLNQVVQAAQKAGKPIKVAPTLAKILATGSTANQPSVSELRKQAEEMNKPGGVSSLIRQGSDLHDGFHKAGYAQLPSSGVPASAKPVHTHYYDPERDELVAV